MRSNVQSDAVAHKRFFGRLFGVMPSGETVEEFTLANSSGLSVSVISYGAIVSRLLIPDRQGQLADVVCGFDNLDQYLVGHPYFGCVAGRVAGRIGDSRFQLDGVNYPLAANDPPNHLHGGRSGFDKKLWTVDSANGSAVHFTLVSPEGEEGYPGRVAVRVSYCLTEANELRIEYEATASAPTPLSLTHHGYFNLAGEGSGPIDDHVLTIDAASYAPVDDKMTLLGRRVPVTAENDFRQPRRLGDAVPELWHQHGDLYFINDGRISSGGILNEVARLSHPPSGRAMTIASSEPCLQLYTGVSLDGSLVGKGGRPYEKFGAVCLECERYPDGVNTPALGDIVLRPGQVYRQDTVYSFGTV